MDENCQSSSDIATEKSSEVDSSLYCQFCRLGSNEEKYGKLLTAKLRDVNITAHIKCMVFHYIFYTVLALKCIDLMLL